MLLRVTSKESFNFKRPTQSSKFDFSSATGGLNLSLCASKVDFDRIAHVQIAIHVEYGGSSSGSGSALIMHIISGVRVE